MVDETVFMNSEALDLQLECHQLLVKNLPDVSSTPVGRNKLRQSNAGRLDQLPKESPIIEEDTVQSRLQGAALMEGMTPDKLSKGSIF